MGTRIIATALASATATTGWSFAGDVSLTFNGTGNARNVSISFDDGRSADDDSDASFSTVRAGEMLWTNEFGRSVTTFCVQVNETISRSQTVCYDAVGLEELPDGTDPGPMSPTAAGLVADLFARYIDPATGTLAAGAIAGTEQDAAAAFQVVLWEITHESVSSDSLVDAAADLDLAAGAFRANLDSAVTSVADSILSSLGDGGFGGGMSILGLSHATRQDQLMVVPVPLPALLAGAGLAGVAILRRRMR